MRRVAGIVLLLLWAGCKSDADDPAGAAGSAGSTPEAGSTGGAGTSSAGSPAQPPTDAATGDAATDAGANDAATAADASSLPALCSLPSEAGPCEALIPRYYHAAQSHSCEAFDYGGCEGNANNFETLAACEDACDVTPRSMACSITAEDAALPGVKLHVEGDSCRVQTGHAHDFRYQLEIDDAIGYQAPNSFNGCGRCGGYTDDPRSLVDFSIGADDVWYCVCDQGCCPPNVAQAVTLQTGSFDGTIEWPGRQWRGPSDTSMPLGDAFPAGEYEVSVTFSVPGVGSVTARLPIEVWGDPGPPTARCEVDGVIYASGQGGIGDPQSCNTCSCEDGQLVCTEIGCLEPCPDGTAYGTSCSQCGPTDACEVVRHDCLPTCTDSDDCTGSLGFCSGGVCKNVCG